MKILNFWGGGGEGLNPPRRIWKKSPLK